MEFRVKALDGSSGVTSCVIDAVNEADARRQIALRNLRVISLEPARRLGRLPLMLRLLSYLPQADPERPGKRPWSAIVREARV